MTPAVTPATTPCGIIDLDRLDLDRLDLDRLVIDEDRRITGLS